MVLVAGGITLVRARAPEPPRGPALHVPRARSPVKLDARPDDWQAGVVETGRFKSVDGQVTPDSEARLVWRDDKLYLLLYAADQDIRSSVRTPDAPLWPEDAFKLTFTPRGTGVTKVIWVSAAGTLTDAAGAGEAPDRAWQSGALVAHAFDGSLNDPSDEDEEWLVELAIPLAALGVRGVPGERIGFSVRRCDVPKGMGRRCAAWGEPDGEIELD